MASAPTALVLNCTLKPSPEPSSTQKLADEVLAELASHGITGETVRVVDHDVRPGVQADMGHGDEWPAIREKVLAARILVLATPTWMGRASSVARRVLERLDAELSETDDSGRPTMFGKVAIVVAVGNEDGAHEIFSEAAQGLNDVGFTIPAQGNTYWNDQAMGSTDYKDLPETPESTASATKTAAANAAHLARLLESAEYPAP
jgi:multimeric flavodoxin WrbA